MTDFICSKLDKGNVVCIIAGIQTIIRISKLCQITIDQFHTCHGTSTTLTVSAINRLPNDTYYMYLNVSAAESHVSLNGMGGDMKFF